MNVSEHIDVISREGTRILDAATRTSLGAAVPTCPDWQVRDLLHHLGSIHRWVTSLVREALPTPIPSLEDNGGPWPDDSVLLDWFAIGHGGMVQALQQAPKDLVCWSFFPVLPALPFWARRQAHENGIHRADLEGVTGPITAFDPVVAADGIDELLVLLASGPGRGLRTEELRVLHVRAGDVGHSWFIHAGPHGSTVSFEFSASDCTVSGQASDLLLLLWNRRLAHHGLEIAGDASLLNLWRESVHVRSK
jgi:uncharacterized protein (TIGR03083 family)